MNSKVRSQKETFETLKIGFPLIARRMKTKTKQIENRFVAHTKLQAGGTFWSAGVIYKDLIS